MAQQNNRTADDEFQARSETIHRKKASAERGNIMPEVPKDAERARYEGLLKKAQQSGDDVSLKAHTRR
jgi:hypothetical protein